MHPKTWAKALKHEGVQDSVAIWGEEGEEWVLRFYAELATRVRARMTPKMLDEADQAAFAATNVMYERGSGRT